MLTRSEGGADATVPSGLGEPRVLLVGGFLGSGKTTAIARLARMWMEEGRRVGIITNDQAAGLVDSELLAPYALGLEEIAGGCFCCRFDALAEAAGQLKRRHAPDIILAEPVGSCTDIVATVVRPLQRLYAEDYRVAPFSVLVDPLRVRQVLIERETGGFSPKIVYIFRTQLEEADVVLLNKVDTLSDVARRELVDAVRRALPGRPVLEVSALTGEGFEAWLEAVDEGKAEEAGTHSMTVDYDLYAEGEAELGWLNATAELRSAAGFDGDRFLQELVAGLARRLHAAGAEPAHLKVLLTVGERHGAVHLTAGVDTPRTSRRLGAPIAAGPLIVNARVHTSPVELERAVRDELEELSARFDLSLEPGTLACFRPGRPTPVHRMAD